MARATVAEGDGIEPMFGKHFPVKVTMLFQFQAPASAKKRTHPSVKPDIDKLQRAILDALSGVAFADDAQVVRAWADKVYGPVDMVCVTVEEA